MRAYLLGGWIALSIVWFSPPGVQAQSLMDQAGRTTSSSPAGITTQGSSFGQSAANFSRDRTTGGGSFVGGGAQAGGNTGGFVGGGVASGTTSGGRTGRASTGVSRANTRGATTGGRGGTSANNDVIRAALRVAFDSPRPTPSAPLAQLEPRLAQRFAEPSWTRSRSPIQIRVEGTTAVLTGSVSTPYDRSLAERVALLEPGIWSVRNELTLAPNLETR